MSVLHINLNSSTWNFRLLFVSKHVSCKLCCSKVKNVYTWTAEWTRFEWRMGKLIHIPFFLCSCQWETESCNLEAKEDESIDLWTVRITPPYLSSSTLIFSFSSSITLFPPNSSSIASDILCIKNKTLEMNWSRKKYMMIVFFSSWS